MGYDEVKKSAQNKLKKKIQSFFNHLSAQWTSPYE